MKRQRVELIDDLDGSAADESLTFALDGTVYAIDLSSPHAETLRKGLAPFVAAAQKVGSGRVTRVVPRQVQRGFQSNPHLAARERTQEENRAIRRWANANGYEVADRGAIKFDIVAAYKDAMQAQQNRAAVKGNGAVKGDATNGLFLAATADAAAPATGILKNVATPKRTEIAPAKKTAQAATTNKVVAKAAPAKRAARRRSTAA